MSQYYYIQSESELWTVGTGEGKNWLPESDHMSPQAAAARIAFLNGEQFPTKQIRAECNELLKTIAKAKTCFTGHNLLSTATESERLQTIKNFLEWWNNDAVPILEKYE